MPLITIPREMGSLGKDVAAQVALQLGKKVIHHEIIDQLADKMRMRKTHVVRFLEGKAGILEKMSTDQTSLSIYTADEILRIAASGDVAVIRGWGANHLLKPIPHVVRVRVCASFGLRVKRMMERLDTTDQPAVEKEIHLSEEAITAITRRHFDVVAESLRGDIRLLAEGQVALQERLEDVRTDLKGDIAKLDRRVIRLEATRR